ncbi:MAG: hypothetical protein U5K28_07330 [Halobacteriales archaeon]|nr:hypothetical protein [Halobacteriales archaeon]
MKRLIIHGDPGIRKGAIIELDDQELYCFSVTRNGDWHGPDEVQLWCTVGSEDEQDDFDRRDFIPMQLDVETADADAVEVIKAKGALAV